MIGGAAGRRVIAHWRSCAYGAPMDANTAGADHSHQVGDRAMRPLELLGTPARLTLA
jgi:hypothetical protein